MSKTHRHRRHDRLEETQNEELFKTMSSTPHTQEEDGLEDELENEGEVTHEEEDGNSQGKKSRHRYRLMNALLNNEGEANVTNVRDLIKSIELNGEWFRRNLKFIMVTTLCLMVFVTNRYQAQQEQIEEAKLKKELAEMKYKWLTRFSELTTFTRQSRIEEQLKLNGDTTLTHSKQAPFLIKATKKESNGREE